MNIGLNENYKKEMSEMLNSYLSNVQIAYMNARGYHWNITGPQFFALHEKFEVEYNNLAEIADGVAERILMLDGKPVHAFSEYIKTSTIKEKTDISSGRDTINALLDDISVLLKSERQIIAFAADNNDEGTVAFISEIISSQEKMSWMYGSLLKERSLHGMAV